MNTRTIATVPVGLTLISAFCGCYSGDDHRCVVDEPGAQQAAEFDALFEREGPGWTGGSAVRSVALPDGRVVWLFGFTFLGTVNSDGSRALDTPQVANSIVLQDGGTLTTLHGGSEAAPEPFFEPICRTGWYTPLDAMIEGDRLRVFLAHTVDFEYAGRVDVATLRLDDLAIDDIAPVSFDSTVSFGTSLLDDGDRVYIYGVEDRVRTEYLHVARATRGDVRGLTTGWQFFDGRGWTMDPRSSARLSDQVASSFGVVPVGQRLLLITQDTFFHADVDVLEADSPIGPFLHRRTLFCSPETGGDVVTFNAVPHRDFTAGNSILASCSVDSRRVSDLFADASLARPRFVWLRVP